MRHRMPKEMEDMTIRLSGWVRFLIWCVVLFFAGLGVWSFWWR